MILINKKQFNKILNSKKDFCFFNIDKNNKATKIVLTSDYNRYYSTMDKFRVISTIKKETEFITI